MTAETKDFVCLACRHEQHTPLKPCEKCQSRKLEHKGFV